VGNRQKGREISEHVTQVSAAKGEIFQAIQKQIERGRYAPSTLYGDGHVSERVADAIAKLKPYIQKHLAFINEEKFRVPTSVGSSLNKAD
jgi:UDP-N-acetylglucosamine 2-epimerase